MAYFSLSSGSDCLHMFTSSTEYSLHILTTVSHGETTICKGKYSDRFLGLFSYFAYNSIYEKQLSTSTDSGQYHIIRYCVVEAGNCRTHC